MKPQKHKKFVALLEKAELTKSRSERHLAKLVGATNTDVRRWKLGKGSPDIEVYERLASLLETDMNGLIAELNEGIEEDDIGSSGEVGGLKKKTGTRLMAIANELAIIARQLLDAEINPNKIKDMVTECVAGTTDEELKAQIDFLSLDRLNWDSFQSIARGDRLPQDPIEVEELVVIVDSEEKFTLDAWLVAAHMQIDETEENCGLSQQNV